MNVLNYFTAFDTTPGANNGPDICGPYSYLFDAQFGYLDYGMASASLLPQVARTTTWHINADEPDLLDYDMTFKRPAQDAVYTPDPFRSSDDDPVIVGLDLTASPTIRPGLRPKGVPGSSRSGS
jgi:predicted extracellular nuclease